MTSWEHKSNILVHFDTKNRSKFCKIVISGLAKTIFFRALFPDLAKTQKQKFAFWNAKKNNTG